MATVSANGKYNYSYDASYNGTTKTLDQWVQACHKINCQENGWAFNPLKKGAFGYDNIAVCLVHFFTLASHNPNATEDELADAIHRGWCENYLYWRENKPWLPTKTSLYTKAAKPLGDAQRNMCAETKYQDLPKEEKDKDIVFVRAMKKISLSNNSSL